MKKPPANPRQHDLRPNGLAIRAWEWPGDPPGALLLHGIGNYGRFWDLVATEVAGRRRLVAPDARGHGESGRPESGYTAEDYIADALAVADACGLNRFVLAGHSMGGGHAIGLAALHPERVLGLVIIDVGPELLPEGRERAFRLTSERPERFASDDEAIAYLKATSPGYTNEVYGNRLAWALRRQDDGGLAWRSSKAALLHTFGDRSRTGRLWELLPQIRCPAIVLRGTRSYVLGPEVARRMVAVMPQARLIEVDAGHNVPLDRPKETAEAIIEVAG